MLPKIRRPIHPGEIIRFEYIVGYYLNILFYKKGNNK